MKYFFIFVYFTSIVYSVELIPNYNYGALPTNVDLNMNTEDYTFTMAMLGLTSAFGFWLGWNSHT